MANQKIVLEVIVTDKGTLKIASNGIDNLGKKARNAGNAYDAVSKSSAKLTDHLNKGTIGTANATKNFSKLAEGSGGLVAAYATLAANIFAVTAAFNALRGASQVQQVFDGLTASGNRTGRTLTVVAQQLKEVTGNAVSTEQALRSTAQITSAGFGAKEVLALGEAANNTSFALGRNLTDSLDRLSRGVVKLEPELLDELGIMTKLTESNTRYAASLGKNVSQLSNFEKRQGFLNAVIAEANAKFGGLADNASDSKAYDRLASTFADLTKNIFTAINTAVIPFIKLISGSQFSMAGAALLFVSTIRGSLLGGLARLASKQLEVAEASRESSKALLEQAKAAHAADVAAQQTGLNKARGAVGASAIGPKAYQQIAEEFKKGAVNAAEFDKAVAKANLSLERSIRLHEQQITSGKSPKGVLSPEAIANKQDTVNYLRGQQQALKDLSDAEKKYASNTIASSELVKKIRVEARVADITANAQAKASTAIALAGNLDVRKSFEELRNAVGKYSVAQRLANKDSNALGKAMGGLSTASFALSTGIKSAGAAFFSFLPYMGLLVAAIGALQSVIEALKSKQLKELEASMERLGEITKTTGDKVREYNKIQASNATAGIKAQTTLVLQANALAELADAYAEVAKRADEYAKSRDGAAKVAQRNEVAGFLTALGEGSKSGQNRAEASYLLGVKQNSKALDLFQNEITRGGTFFDNKEMRSQVQTLDSMLQVAGKAGERIINLHGGFDRLNKLPTAQKLTEIRKIIAELGNDAAGSAQQIQDLVDSLKNTDLAVGEFLRSAIQATPYDKVVDNLHSLTDAIGELEIAQAKGKVTGNEWKKILTEIGPDLGKFLSVGTAKQVDQYRQADAIVQELNQRKQANEVLSRYDEARLNAAKQTLQYGNAHLNQLSYEIRQAQERFEVAQQTERTIKSQLTLVQAQIQANSKNYEITGAGEAARIDAENRAKDLQIASLETQKALLSAAIAQQRSRLETLKIEDGITHALSKQERLILLNTLQQEKLLLDQATAAGAPSSILTALQQSYDATNGLINKYQEYEGIQREIQGLQAAEKSLQNEIAAIVTSKLTAEQKAAAVAQKNVEILTANRSAYQEIKDTVNQTNDALRKSERLIAQRSGSLADELQLINEQAKRERERTILEAENSKKKLAAERQVVTAARAKAVTPADLDANQSLLNYYDNQLHILDLQVKSKVDNIEATRNQEILEKAIFDTRKEGLEWQQQSLQLIEKEASAARELSDALQKNVELRIKLTARKLGIELTPEGERGLEIRAAAEAYKLAVQEVELKKALIDAEYGLIDAQRALLREELGERKAALEQIRAQTGDTRLDPRINQLGSALDKLDLVDTDKTASILKRTLEVNLENAALQLETALRPQYSSNNPFLNRLMSNRILKDAKKAAAEAVATQREDPSAYQTVKATNYMPSKVNPQIESNNNLIDAINRLIAAIEGQLATAVSAGGNLKSLEDAAAYGAAQGAKITEFKGHSRVGQHAAHSKHYTGEAFDLNMAPGFGEINDPKIAAKMDALAEYYRAQGFKVLWRTAGHFNHMHVEITNKVKELSDKTAQQLAVTTEQTSKIAVSAIDAMTSKVDQAIENQGDPIVVTGNRPSMKDIADQVGMPNIPIETTLDKAKEGLGHYEELTSKIAEDLRNIGPEGGALAAAIEGFGQLGYAITGCFEQFQTEGATFTDKFEAVAGVIQSVLSTVTAISSAATDARIANVEREIDAEQKRDGKSAESVAKIAALEKKKDAIAKKEFNTKKKLAIASAIVATAQGVAEALKYGPIVGPILAAVVGALGLAQIAIIASTQYQSTSSPASGVTSPAQLKIGKIGDSVDLAKRNTNPGGEIGYLRGTDGYGSNSSNYRVVGSAYGGRYPRGYGKAGFLVGEKGPEVITPDVPLRVTPTDQVNSATPIDAKISIHAIDARGVEKVLLDQRGNIISMLREAANASGQTFLENVDVNVYTRPNVSRL